MLVHWMKEMKEETKSQMDGIKMYLEGNNEAGFMMDYISG